MDCLSECSLWNHKINLSQLPRDSCWKPGLELTITMLKYAQILLKCTKMNFCFLPRYRSTNDRRNSQKSNLHLSADNGWAQWMTTDSTSDRAKYKTHGPWQNNCIHILFILNSHSTTGLTPCEAGACALWARNFAASRADFSWRSAAKALHRGLGPSYAEDRSHPLKFFVFFDLYI